MNAMGRASRRKAEEPSPRGTTRQGRATVLLRRLGAGRGRRLAGLAGAALAVMLTTPHGAVPAAADVPTAWRTTAVAQAPAPPTAPGVPLTAVATPRSPIAEDPADDDGSATLPPSPGSAELADEVAALRVEVERLEVVTERAVEEYNAARSELSTLTAAELAAQRELEAARRRLDHDRGEAARRVRALYRAGGAGGWQLLVWQQADLGSAAEAMRVAEDSLARDAATIARARSRLDEVTGLSSEVQAQRAATAEAAERARARRQQAETSWRATTELLARTDARLVAALETERRAAEEAAIAAALAVRSGGAAGGTAAVPAGSATSSGGVGQDGLLDVERLVAAAVAAAPSGRAATAIGHAAEELGSPYRWGASGPDSFDCSGLTSSSYARAGVVIPRTSRQQYVGLPQVSVSELVPGDLVFYAWDGRVASIHHVGLYLGSGLLIHAPRTGDVVRVAAVEWPRVVGAVRPAP